MSKQSSLKKCIEEDGCKIHILGMRKPSINSLQAIGSTFLIIGDLDLSLQIFRGSLEETKRPVTH
ncbi:MAG TPA: hypothetical protein VI037_00825 [Nitrososphaera sp.]